MHIYKFVVGDWSGDGHEKTIIYYFQTNLLIDSIKPIYKRNAKFIGFDLFDYCEEYNDNLIPKKKLDVLSNYMDLSTLDEDDSGENYEIFPDDFRNIFKTIMNLNEPLLETIELYEFPPNLCGGYGLFD